MSIFTLLDLALLLLAWVAGGLVTALILRAEQALGGWKDVVWVTLAWTLGGAVFAIGTVAGMAAGGSTVSTNLPVGAAALGAAVGGAGMIWLIRRAGKKRPVS